MIQSCFYCCMKTRIKNIEECRKLFQVEIPRDVVEKTVEDVYRRIKMVAKIPGFRPGSAPQDLLEKHYSKEVEQETMKRLVPEGYSKALENHRVTPVGYPRVFNVNFERNKPLTFEAEVDTKPSIRLKKYKGIKVGRKKISVSQKEIDTSLSRLRNIYAQYKDVPGPVKKGDYAICDVEAFIEGKPISRKNKNMWVMADKEASLLGMGEKLVGLNKGETREIEADLPGDYPDKKYAGKPAKFKILINGIKEKEMPALDDSLAKNLKHENLVSLKKEIESQLFARKEKDLDISMKNQILERLLKGNMFHLPPGMVSRQKEVLSKRIEMELGQKGIKKEEAEKKIKELDEKLAQDAKDKVQIYFILDDIAGKENINVSDKDTEERLKTIAVSTGRPENEIKEYYKKENLLGGLREEIKESKVLDFLLKEAEISDEK